MLVSLLISTILLFCGLRCHDSFLIRAPTTEILRSKFKVFAEIEPIRQEIFHHLGDIKGNGDDVDRYYKDKKAAYNLNVGRAQEVLRRELPMVFVLSNLDFSIFGPQITVGDGNSNRMVMQKSLYQAAVKSMRIASSWSSIYPSMNVRKIEYIESESLIQCLVDVVLPDSVRVDGQAFWEGMFYFGLDEEGLINSHVMDRKISNMKPSPLPHQSSNAYPWLFASPAAPWSESLLVGAPSYCERGSDMIDGSAL